MRISAPNAMNKKLQILLIDNRVAERQTLSNALECCQLNLQVEQVDNIDSAIAISRLHQFDCVFLSDGIVGEGYVTNLQTSGLNAPIVLLTENTDLLLIDNWQNFGIIDVVEEREINPLSIARIVRNSIRIYKSESNAEHLRQELRDRQEQINHQAQVIATQRLHINQKNIELITASQLKSQFLSTISHELRTPMHAIQGFAQVLLKMRSDQISSQQRDMVERIYNNSQQLLQLLNDILDFGKLEAGTLDLQPQFFDIAVAVGCTVEEMKAQAISKNLSLNFQNHLQNGIIYNDQMRVRQIVINLLSNAIKFTEAGQVRIELEDLPAEGLAIIVHDTGIGIDTSQVENIFDVFHQLDSSLSRKYGGVGMGLAIVNALVYMMQGRIIVSSEPGKGSTFRVEIPRQIMGVQPSSALAENAKLNAIASYPSIYPQQDVLLFPKHRMW